MLKVVMLLGPLFTMFDFSQRRPTFCLLLLSETKKIFYFIRVYYTTKCEIPLTHFNLLKLSWEEFSI